MSKLVDLQLHLCGELAGVVSCCFSYSFFEPYLRGSRPVVYETFEHKRLASKPCVRRATCDAEGLLVPFLGLVKGSQRETTHFAGAPECL